MRNFKLFGRSVPAIAIALLLIGGLASAALLTYYGMITATVDVQQSILLDGKAWPDSQVTDTISEAAPGGETFCFEHTLKNQMSVEGTVDFTDDCLTDIEGYEHNCSGITKTYYEDVAYSYEHTISRVVIKVEDLGNGWMKWTYTGDTTTRPEPKMTVAINYPNGFAITTFDDGSHSGWYYAPDVGSVVQFNTSYDSGSYEGWVETGRVVNNDGSKALWVEIKKSALKPSFVWHGYANFYNAQVWINPTSTTSGDGSTWVAGEIDATIANTITSPLTIASRTTLPFEICYSFAENIYPGKYTITTGIVPA